MTKRKPDTGKLVHMMGPNEGSLQERLDHYSMPVPECGCQIWIGGYGKHGYGALNVGGGKIETAHRLSWKAAYGPISDDLCVLHKCDTPACINPEHLFLENSTRTFGEHTISGFIKYMPMMVDPEDSMVLRIAQNSNYRKWFTGNQAEKVNHHIPEDNQEFFMIKGRWEKPKDPVIDVKIKRVMQKAKEEGLTDEEFVYLKNLKEEMKIARGARLPLEKAYDKVYIFKKGEWIPELVIRHNREKVQEEKDAVATIDYNLIHNALRAATNTEDINAVFLRNTVVTGEGDDLDLEKYKHEKWVEKNKKNPKVVEIRVAAGSSTMNYSPVSYKPKHYQAPSKHGGGKRAWPVMISRMKKDGIITPFQEEMAIKKGFLVAA